MEIFQEKYFSFFQSPLFASKIRVTKARPVSSAALHIAQTFSCTVRQACSDIVVNKQIRNSRRRIVEKAQTTKNNNNKKKCIGKYQEQRRQII